MAQRRYTLTFPGQTPVVKNFGMADGPISEALRDIFGGDPARTLAATITNEQGEQVDSSTKVSTLGAKTLTINDDFTIKFF